MGPFALLVTADDAGFDATSDDAILACVERGIVRAASCVAGGASSERFLRRAAPTIGVGWHINLTEGIAVSGPRPGLTDASGRFVRGKGDLWQAALEGALPVDLLWPELAAQWSAWIGSGRAPTHADGHNHVHLLPLVEAWLARVCPQIRRRGVLVPSTEPALMPHPAAERVPPFAAERAPVLGATFALEPTALVFVNEVRALRARWPWLTRAEFMVHPGQRTGSLFGRDIARAMEKAVLCDPSLERRLGDDGVVIASAEAFA